MIGSIAPTTSINRLLQQQQQQQQHQQQHPHHHRGMIMMENTNSAISPDGLINRHPHQHSIDGILAGQRQSKSAFEISKNNKNERLYSY
jgi:hypothetical protein